MQKLSVPATLVIIAIIVLLAIGWRFFKVVPAGTVGVATLFGSVVEDSYEPGLHIPVNPFFSWRLYDTKDQTHMESAQVPSQDQLLTKVDVSVQYRLDDTEAWRLVQDTGTFDQAKQKYLVPALRSNLREAGKSIRRAEDFFLEETQEKLQDILLGNLKEYLEPKGILVERVFIRDISLPSSIMRNIEEKKAREQEVEKQRAELERVRIEQEQKVVQAQAERAAAEEEAERRKLIADAQAYEIIQLTNAIADNPAYVQLQALEALKAISKDPSSKLYFIDGDSPTPLPLMNIGDPVLNRGSN